VVPLYSVKRRENLRLVAYALQQLLGAGERVHRPPHESVDAREVADEPGSPLGLGYEECGAYPLSGLVDGHDDPGVERDLYDVRR
jgi:hypothetical protein